MSIPIRETILHIRSKDADIIDDGLNSNLNMLIQTPIVVNSDEICIISVVSAEIPLSFYNISLNLQNDKLLYTSGLYVTLPSENYDVYRLVAVLNASALPFTASWDINSYKMTFSNSSGVVQSLLFSQCPKLAQVLGFQAVDLNIASGSSAISSGIVDLATIHSIFIKSNISTGNVISTRKGNSSILQKISCDVNFGSIIYLSDNDHIQQTLTTAHIIDDVTLRLTDQNNIPIDFNGVNYEIALVFKVFSRSTVFPKYVDNSNNIPIQSTDNFDAVFTSTSTADIDSTHVIEDETQIEQVVKTTLGNSLIDRLRSNLL
jgi:hypothetical protein